MCVYRDEKPQALKKMVLFMEIFPNVKCFGF